MKKILHKEIFLLIFFIIIFIVFRSINYIYHLNWSGDQATSSIEALKIFQTKTHTLIGPSVSINFQGRQLFTGSITYYMELIFLVMGNWDPVKSSYFFMLFCALMVVPLYYGTKLLVNKKAAILITLIYTLLPYYINYTRFFWNPTFQLSLMPILILFMGIFQRNKNLFILLLISFMLGILMLFHYQFALVIIGMFAYYFFVKKIGFKKYLLVFTLGIILGFSPLLLFEIKHQFYNTKTILLFFQKWNELTFPGGPNTPHYYTSISLILLVGIFAITERIIKKIPYSLIIIIFVSLGIYSGLNYYSRPKTAFWAPTEGWNYLSEKRIYEIIKTTDIKTNYNVANQAYDNRSMVVKYFLKRDNVSINYDDYYHNKYLFVISQDKNYQTDPAYEVATFKPHKILNQWKINDRFNMYLLERLQ